LDSGAVVGDRRGQHWRQSLDVVEKAIYVLRRSDYDPPLFWIAVDGLDPILVKEHLLGHVLGLVFGTESAELKKVVDGPLGQLKAWPWMNNGQLEALEVLMSAYRALKP
jgi:hypothetical protein